MSEGRAGGGESRRLRPAGETGQEQNRHGLRLRALGAMDAGAGDRGHQTPPPLPHPSSPGDGHLPACRAPGSLSEEADRGIWPWDTSEGPTEKGTCVSTHREGRDRQGPSPPTAGMLRPHSQLPGQEQSVSGETEPLQKGPSVLLSKTQPHPGHSLPTDSRSLLGPEVSQLVSQGRLLGMGGS